MTKTTDQVEAAAQVPGAELIPLSALLSLPSGFYDGRWIEGDNIAALVEECVRMMPPQAQPADAPIAYLQESDQHLLHRFIETTEDDESFDIGKDAVKRLANLGVVESCGFGRYGVTMFGYWVHEHYWHQNPSLPLKTNADRDREHRAAMAAAQETPPAPADLWYLQDTRGYVGNDVSWWAKDGNGYTTDVSKAHIYTRADAFKQAAMRGCDRAWPKAYIDGKTRPAVDMQYIDHHAAMAAAQEGGAA